jgi:maltose alpha-D-glucosyltransferase/alpha-amylase
MRWITGLPSKEGGYDRTGARTPMQWDEGPNAGFSSAPADRLYLPVDPADDRPHVAAQRAEPGSLWRQARRLIGLRRSEPGLSAEAAVELLTPTDPGYPLCYVRGGQWLVALNPSNTPRSTTLSLASTPEPAAVCGAAATRHGQSIAIEMEGRSYGVFRLR